MDEMEGVQKKMVRGVCRLPECLTLEYPILQVWRLPSCPVAWKLEETRLAAQCTALGGDKPGKITRGGTLAVRFSFFRFMYNSIVFVRCFGHPNMYTMQYIKYSINYIVQMHC
jgi:hypothetical protein